VIPLFIIVSLISESTLILKVTCRFVPDALYRPFLKMLWAEATVRQTMLRNNIIN
jgi:hypothetical protein